LSIFLTLAAVAQSQPTAFDPAKVVMVKADDFIVPNQQVLGDVEFWNHGWDHSRFPATGTATSWEFRGTGLAFQQTHFSDAQTRLLSAAGRNVIAFGTPYNQSDADTIAFTNNTPAVRLFSPTTALRSGAPD
jgi:peptidoglycan/xylan/chitin deacetylase (PgdA/CDA1 family)